MARQAATGGAKSPTELNNPENYTWEQAHAPRISRGYFLAVTCGYAAWVAFLAFIAVHRWILTLR